MRAHTLGPWIVATSCSWRRILTDSGQPVCVRCIQAGDNHPDLYFPDGGADGPDARLIAAAPDLLAALQRLIANGDIRDAAHKGDIAQARAAMAKATGKQQANSAQMTHEQEAEEANVRG